jgi:hypothetical protein
MAMNQLTRAPYPNGAEPLILTKVAGRTGVADTVDISL